MKHEQARHGFKGMILAILGMTLLGGCAQLEPGTLELFVADLSRAALSALLL